MSRLLERQDQLIEIARRLGLDFYDIRFESVPWEVMDEIAAYGLPIRAQHWSYGRLFERNRVHGQMGLSKIYEIVINNDPVYAFLLDTNSEVENLLVTAHVAAHADFFKHNACFESTDRKMVTEAMEHAARIESYAEEYGAARVERIMDIALALERHIDPHKGVFRKGYPGRKVVERHVRSDQYADLTVEGVRLSKTKRVIGDKMPPHPERDLLWFLARYAPVENWERDILEMVREEAYYFYPQFTTKIINEGWASYWHAEIMKEYRELSPSEMVDFAALHGGVVQPGSGMSVNPYYLGYKIFVDVFHRYNDMYKAGESDIDGRAKLFEVRRHEDDFSFLRNYLTESLSEEMGLYTYAPACKEHPGGHDACPECEKIALDSRDLAEVVEGLLRPRYHYGMPRITIDDVAQGKLFLNHDEEIGRVLDREFAEKTMGYIFELWKAPILLSTRNDRGQRLELTMDEKGFHASIKGRNARRLS